MTLRLGFFQNFKSSDAVLVAGTTEDISSLSSKLSQLNHSTNTELAIHQLAVVSTKYPVKLFVTQSNSSSNSGFYWLCTSPELNNILPKLAALISSGNGHQYFKLAGSNVQLIISVGEYNESWWQQHG
jgi:hypothetical protein